MVELAQRLAMSARRHSRMFDLVLLAILDQHPQSCSLSKQGFGLFRRGRTTGSERALPAGIGVSHSAGGLRFQGGSSKAPEHAMTAPSSATLAA